MTLISCLMPTYNKCPKSKTLIDEALHSFLIQQNSVGFETELIICNDCPQQTLVYAHPLVTVYNLDQRFPNLGEKLNWMTDQSRGELLCRWDDDDIQLPWGLEYRYKKLIEQELDYICPTRFFGTNGEKTSYGFGSYAQCLYRRSLHQAIGGYPAGSFGEDTAFEKRAKAKGYRVLRDPISLDDTFYFYRWGTGSRHLSGYGAGGDGWTKIGRDRIVPGTYVLNPHWSEDYLQRAELVRQERRKG